MTPIFDKFMFNSSIAASAYKANSWYMAQDFKFRLPSEHTIDGVAYDMEFQFYFISKDPQNGFSYSVISVLFDRTNFTEKVNNESIRNATTENTINQFIDSLELKNLNSATEAELEEAKKPFNAKKILVGDFMNAINLKRRWIYKASTSMPPC